MTLEALRATSGAALECSPGAALGTYPILGILGALNLFSFGNCAAGIPVLPGRVGDGEDAAGPCAFLIPGFIMLGLLTFRLSTFISGSGVLGAFCPGIFSC